MGRRRRNNVYRHFMLQEESQTSTCLLCYKRLNSTHGSNLMNHLKFMHKLEYKQILALNSEKVPPIATPPRITQNSNDDDDSNQSDVPTLEVDVEKFYSIAISSNLARCDICQKCIEITGDNLISHLKKDHPKVLKSTNDSEDDEQDNNLYQEVVYLYDSDSKSPKNLKPSRLTSSASISSQKQKLKRKASEINRQRANVESRQRRRIEDSVACQPVDEFVEEVHNFGKYVTCLLKTLPKDVCTQLQMEIINLIMTAKIKNMSPSATNNSLILEKLNNVSDGSSNQSIVLTLHDSKLDSALQFPESNVLETPKTENL